MPKQSKASEVDDMEQRAIDEAATPDSDAPPLTDEQLAQFRPWQPWLQAPAGTSKVSVNIAYDSDLLDVFKSTGAGWEEGMNAVLREWAIRRGYLPPA
ncbi:BrnA antitoxin family protein [Duganella sp. LX20W]|uniref:BrnA antitoxin family protein n=1 Tax=Rugamonas brunnea TaxID=2758569 RepID=A0A7W2EVC1_9BURK|nr:BrnA antitoxin family protein [Rugamonas brunnea]MBA5639244.1 BrnA antitoxin family protein [Rugamonas brunnea]